MKKLILVCTLTVLFLNLHAQEMWGISNSNYSGAMGLSLNPSTIVGAPYKYDFNIFATDVFLENNYAWFSASDKIVYRTFAGTSDSPTLITDDQGSSRKSLFMHEQILGPAFIWSADPKMSVGFHLSFRTEVGAVKVPYSLNSLGELTGGLTPGTQTFHVPGFSTAAMSWAEVGFTYGKVMRNEVKKYEKWAVTVNYLIPAAGLYIDVKDINYTKTDSTAMVQNIQANIGHSVPFGNNNNSGGLFDGRGWGVGSTIGFTVMKGRSQRAYSLKKAADDLQKYKVRWGFSLIDVGMIRFSSEDTRLIQLHSSGAYSANDINGLQFNSFQHFDTALINKVGGSVGNIPFVIWLPTALSVQFDYSLTPHWYANITALNRVHFAPNQVARGNQDVLSLRYETRHFEMAFNLNLFEYSSVSSGFAFRYRWFVLGTDRLSQMASVRNFNAVDLYFGFKVNVTSRAPKTVHKHTCPAYKANG